MINVQVSLKSGFFSSMIWPSVLKIGCGLLFICFKISKCQERDYNKRADGERRLMTKKHTPCDQQCTMRVTVLQLTDEQIRWMHVYGAIHCTMMYTR